MAWRNKYSVSSWKLMEFWSQGKLLETRETDIFKTPSPPHVDPITAINGWTEKEFIELGIQLNICFRLTLRSLKHLCQQQVPVYVDLYAYVYRWKQTVVTGDITFILNSTMTQFYYPRICEKVFVAIIRFSDPK